MAGCDRPDSAAGEIFLLAVAAAVAEDGLCVPDGVIFNSPDRKEQSYLKKN